MSEAIQDTVRELMAHAAIVLVSPKFAENIGSAARTAANMGIGQLILVCREIPDRERMLKLATAKAAHLIDNLELHENLGDALAPFGWVLGTSARQGKKRTTVNSPRQLMSEVLPQLKNNRVALLFGPEDRGLANEELRYCNQITTIPTVDFSSLNLAQAVAILSHELHYSVLEAASRNDLPKAAPKQGNKQELESMFVHVEEALQSIGFLKTEDDDYWMKSIRQFLGRIGLKSKEIKIIRGVCRQMLWHDGQRRQERS
ncbi:MAG: tRNA methyltransferase [Desulfobulbaceae bacterium]|nr:tRNA methyltransferase [Desulfobulbaceae bacterium]HIJ90327.1 tRNA methyltransferase [Deltaproteobacteria bacterium]